MRTSANKVLIRVCTVIAGLVFLNMSFFAAEVTMLDIKSKSTLENIANLMMNGGLEEERSGESSHDTLEKEINLLMPRTLNHQLNLIQISIKRYGNAGASLADLPYLDVNSPPPKSLTSFPA